MDPLIEPVAMGFDISLTRADDPEVSALVELHFALMRSQSPAESCHVLPAADLMAKDVSVFALREAGDLLAIGALRMQGSEAEVKSMHTSEKARGRGAARALLNALISHAQQNGVTRLNLETGSSQTFAPSRALYSALGFKECAPFDDYVADPLSVFMTRAI